MKNKETFIELFKNNIKREGADKLLDWITHSDFFTAPASTKFHSAFKGGLCEHSIKAFHRFTTLLKTEYGENWQDVFSMESAAICALLHDVCKINYYKSEMRNTKVNGEWVQVPYYTVEDKFPYGHGEKSVYILNTFIKLTAEEAMIINWHMGEFDTRVRGGSYALPEVFYRYPNALLFHCADNLATYLDESREG